MVARKTQPMDRAAHVYIKREADARGIGRAPLAERAGIPYQTLRGWWDAANPPAMSIADLSNLLGVLGVDGAKAFKEIQRIAATIEDSTDQ